MFRFKKLPHWCLTDILPAFYDVESLTSLEQTARLYSAFQNLVDDYNKYVDEVNKTINEFIDSSEKNEEEFICKINKIMHDYIRKIDEKIKMQDAVIDDAVKYMKTNLVSSLQSILVEMNENGELSEVIIRAFEEFSTKLDGTIVKVEELSDQVDTMQTNLDKGLEDVETCKTSVNELSTEFNTNNEANATEFENLRNQIGAINEVKILNDVDLVNVVEGGYYVIGDNVSDSQGEVSSVYGKGNLLFNIHKESTNSTTQFVLFRNQIYVRMFTTKDDGSFMSVKPWTSFYLENFVSKYDVYTKEEVDVLHTLVDVDISALVTSGYYKIGQRTIDSNAGGFYTQIGDVLINSSIPMLVNENVNGAVTQISILQVNQMIVRGQDIYTRSFQWLPATLQIRPGSVSNWHYTPLAYTPTFDDVYQKGDYAILTGSINVQDYEQAEIEYPDGFYQDNTIVVSFMSKYYQLIDGSEYDSGHWMVNYQNPDGEYVATCYLTEDKIKVGCVDGALSNVVSKLDYKIVLMKYE